jgi:hypothetical protein
MDLAGHQSSIQRESAYRPLVLCSTARHTLKCVWPPRNNRIEIYGLDRQVQETDLFVLKYCLP